MGGSQPDREGEDRAYAGAVGARLRAVRAEQRRSLAAVETASGGEFKASALGAYERGERVISVARLHRLAAVYGVPADALLPGEPVPLGLPPGDGRRGPGVRVDLARLGSAAGPEAAALRRFLSAIEQERQDFNGAVLTVRHDDLRAVAAALGMPVPGVLSRLGSLGVLIGADREDGGPFGPGRSRMPVRRDQ